METILTMTDMITWLKDVRKIDAALITDMKIREVDHDHLGRAIAFPYIVNGEVSAAKFRTDDKRWSSSKGKKRGLYNVDALSRNENMPVVITEGEIDCLSVIQSGFIRAVSLPDGWTKDGNKTEALLEHEEAIKNSPYIIVAGDNDEAGESLPRVCANLFKGCDVRYAVWPDGCKDPNDVLMQFDENSLADALNSAKRIDPPGGLITGFSDLPPLSSRRVLRPGEPFNDRIAYELGALSIGTGTPGNGKTTVATVIGDQIARNENIRVGFFSFETHAYATRNHLSLLRTGRKYGDLHPQEQADLLFELDKSWRMVHRVDTSDERFHLGWLLGMIETLALRDNCKLIIIDPWNELEHLPEPGESLTNYINFALQQIRQTASRLEVHVNLIAHPKKMSDPTVIPDGYSVADSAAFANKPALGWTIHTIPPVDGNDERLVMNTWKVRDTMEYEIEKGITDLRFDKLTMKYSRNSY